MADPVCLTPIGLGIVRQADLLVSTLCILDRSAEDADLAHQSECIADLCPCVDPIEQHVGLRAPLHLRVKRDIGIG